MTWVTASESVRVLDLSNYQRHPHTGAIPDPVEVHNSGLDIQGVILRAALWDDEEPDWAFYEMWSAFREAGFDMMVYHVVRTDKDHEAQVDRLDQLLDGRQPGAIWDDAERRDGSTTQRSREAHQWYLELAEERFSFARVGVYTAPWYWSVVLGYTEWARDWDLWVAGYPYEQDQEQFHEFAPFENRWAPNDSQWRPSLPLGWKGKAQAKGWQFADRGIIPGVTDLALNPQRPHVDLNLFDREWYEEVFPPSGNGNGGDGPDGPPPNGPRPKVTVRVSADTPAVDIELIDEGVE